MELKGEKSSPQKAFTQKGVYDDEITLEFTEKRLYVSKNFLCIASPVFEAMFRNEFKEQKEKRVQMTGKSYDDFLEFLLCINPRILKEIDEKNMLQIAPLADEYQVTAFVSKCKTAMKATMSKGHDTAKSSSNKAMHLKPLRECFNVLKSAIFLNYTDIFDLSVDAIARFGYCLYDDEQTTLNVISNSKSKIDKFGDNKETYGDVRNECVSSFKSLSVELRNQILSRRLQKINDGNFQ